MAWIQSIGVVTIAGGGIAPMRAALNAQGGDLERGWIDELRAPPDRSRESRLRFARSSRLSKLALLATWDAIDGWPESQLADGGIALGTAFGAHRSNDLFYASMIDEGIAGASPRLFSQTLPSSAAAEVSIQLGLTGPMMTFAHGAGAGLSAVGLAAGLVDGRRAPWMLAGAADTLGETLLGALGTAGEHHDRAAEGAAFFVLTPEGPGLARVAGSAQATGVDAAPRVTALALRQAGIRKRDSASLWDLPGGNDDALQRSLGNCFAVGPLLAAGSALDDKRLPALIRATDAHTGSVDALCLR